jgi:hypothetical protein
MKSRKSEVRVDSVHIEPKRFIPSGTRSSPANPRI